MSLFDFGPDGFPTKKAFDETHRRNLEAMNQEPASLDEITVDGVTYALYHPEIPTTPVIDQLAEAAMPITLPGSISDFGTEAVIANAVAVIDSYTGRASLGEALMSQMLDGLEPEAIEPILSAPSSPIFVMGGNYDPYVEQVVPPPPSCGSCSPTSVPPIAPPPPCHWHPKGVGVPPRCVDALLTLCVSSAH